jgi:hypothetical protein
MITVGPCGDHATLNAALAAASCFRSTFPQGGVEVRLLSGFVLAEQVLVRSVDLSHVTLTSVDATVPVQGAAMTATADLAGVERPYVFAAVDGAALPAVSALFVFDKTDAPADVAGVALDRCSTGRIHAGSGVRGVTGIGLIVYGASSCVAHDADFREAVGFGALVEGGSRLAAHRIVLSGCGGGIRVSEASSADIPEADVSGAIGENGDGVLVTQGGTVNAQLAIADGCAQSGFRGRGAGRLNATGAKARGCTLASIYAERGFLVNADRSEAVTQFEGSRVDGTGPVIYAATGAQVVARSAVLGNGYLHAEGAGSVIDAEAADIVHAGAAGAGAVMASFGGRVHLKAATVTAQAPGLSGIWLDGGSAFVQDAVVTSENGGAIRLMNGASANGSGPTFRGGSGKVAVLVETASDLSCPSAAIKVNGTNGIVAKSGARLSIPSATIIEKAGTPANEVLIQTGAFVLAPTTTFTCNLLPNAASAGGLLLR